MLVIRQPSQWSPNSSLISSRKKLNIWVCWLPYIIRHALIVTCNLTTRLTLESEKPPSLYTTSGHRILLRSSLCLVIPFTSILLSQFTAVTTPLCYCDVHLTLGGLSHTSSPTCFSIYSSGQLGSSTSGFLQVYEKIYLWGTVSSSKPTHRLKLYQKTVILGEIPALSAMTFTVRWLRLPMSFPDAL